MKRDIKLDPYAIEKTYIYTTVVEFNGNRLEFFTEWQKRFVNTEIVVLDLLEDRKWLVRWTNYVYNRHEPGEPNAGLS